jgi:hypothetical protein
MPLSVSPPPATQECDPLRSANAAMGSLRHRSAHAGRRRVEGLTSDSGTAGGVLVIAGVLLLVAPFMIDRLERVSVCGAGLELALSRDVAEQGAPKGGGHHRSQRARPADRGLRRASGGVARPGVHRRAHVRPRHAGPPGRHDRRAGKFDAAEIRALFANGTPVIRVMVLGLMGGDPSLVECGIARRGHRQAGHAYRAVRGLAPYRAAVGTLLGA